MFFLTSINPIDKITATKTSKIGGTKGQTKFHIHTKANHTNQNKSKFLRLLLLASGHTFFNTHVRARHFRPFGEEQGKGQSFVLS